MPGSILGTRVTRVEDPELLMGRGRFVGDIRIDGLASVAFVRSPIAHGYISRIDVSAAEQAGGVSGASCVSRYPSDSSATTRATP